MTKFLILSDIHLEISDYNFKTHQDYDAVILAGDIGTDDLPFHFIEKYFNDKHVFYVAGNHEFYGKDINEHYKYIKEYCNKLNNVHFLQNEMVTYNDINIIGATLWTDFAYFSNTFLAEFECKRYMNDFRVIRNGNNKIDIDFLKNEHSKSKKFIFGSLRMNQNKKNIVITHHLPSSLSVSEIYKNDMTTAAFASRLENDILNTNPTLWIHGHTHDSFDYIIGDTRVVCNPRGYQRRDYRENTGFNDDMVVEI